MVSNRSRGVLPGKFIALWPNPECGFAENEVETKHRSAPLAPCQWIEGLETM